MSVRYLSRTLLPSYTCSIEQTFETASIFRKRGGSRPAEATRNGRTVGARRYLYEQTTYDLVGATVADFPTVEEPMSTAVIYRSASPVRRARRPPQLRLTRRGRLVLFLALVAVAVAVFTFLAGPAESTGTTHHPPVDTVVVEPGQTLWGIASDVAPNEDPRIVIHEILDLNALTDAGSIRAGQPLYVPAF